MLSRKYFKVCFQIENSQRRVLNTQRLSTQKILKFFAVQNLVLFETAEKIFIEFVLRYLFTQLNQKTYAIAIEDIPIVFQTSLFCSNCYASQ